jgi:transposase-like protein
VAFDLNLVLNDSNYAQIDHALPYSRSFDDSKNNKVLVLARENQNKGNRTPFEYLTIFSGGEDGERWRNFVAWVNGTKGYRTAKRNRLLRKNYNNTEAQGFRDRNLNDTRYICRFFKNYVEQNLQLAPREDGEINQRCVVVNGQLTAFLRARWGLVKVRSESDRHHALDAVVVASCSHAMVKSLADYARRKEVQFLKEGFPDPETGEIINPVAHSQANKLFPRPTYTTQFKADLVAACQRPGASIAALALHHGMNANVLHRWLKEYDQGRHRLGHADAVIAADQAVKPAFIPIAIAVPESVELSQPSANSSAPGNIRIQCQRNGLSITVDWPVSGSNECAQMLREVLR